MNKIFLIGNLTKDPEHNQTASGVPYCRFSIAVNRSYTNADGERETDFFNIVTWRNQADSCAKYLRKGNKVSVVGSVSINNYEQDGVKRTSVEINASDVEFLTPKSASQDAEPAPTNRKPIRDAQLVEDDGLPF